MALPPWGWWGRQGWNDGSAVCPHGPRSCQSPAPAPPHCAPHLVREGGGRGGPQACPLPRRGRLPPVREDSGPRCAGLHDTARPAQRELLVPPCRVARRPAPQPAVQPRVSWVWSQGRDHGTNGPVTPGKCTESQRGASRKSRRGGARLAATAPGDGAGGGGGLADAGRPLPGLSFPIRVPAGVRAGQRLLGRCWLGAPPPAGGPAPSQAFWKVQGLPPRAQPVALETVSLWRRRGAGSGGRAGRSRQPAPLLSCRVCVAPASVLPRALPCRGRGARSGALGLAGSGSVTLAETAALRTSSARLPVPLVDTPTSPTPLVAYDVSKCINYQEKKFKLGPLTVCVLPRLR